MNIYVAIIEKEKIRGVGISDVAKKERERERVVGGVRISRGRRYTCSRYVRVCMSDPPRQKTYSSQLLRRFFARPWWWYVCATRGWRQPGGGKKRGSSSHTHAVAPRAAGGVRVRGGGAAGAQKKFASWRPKKTKRKGKKKAPVEKGRPASRRSLADQYVAAARILPTRTDAHACARC